MIPISQTIVDKTIASFEPEIIAFTNLAKSKIEELKVKEKKLTVAEINYLNNLIGDLDDYKKLVTAQPSILFNLQSKYPPFPKPNLVKRIVSKAIQVVTNQPKEKTLSNKIITALGYKTLRSDFYPKYFHKIGIKTCVYCNSQLTVTIELKQNVNSTLPKEIKARFQVDHHIPKADYPCFGISLYNLYPTCGPCNLAKSDEPFDFELYTNDITLTQESKFKFRLKTGSVAKYLSSEKIDDLIITFQEPIKNGQSCPGKFQQTFDIEGIYDTQRDLAEELILKARHYNKIYKEELVGNFSSLFTNASLSNRILVGNYTNPDDIHKRPMAKFTQDIARQLKLIK